MGLFRRPVPVDPAEVARLGDELGALRRTLDEHAAAQRAASERVAGRVAALDARRPAPDPRLDDVFARLAELDARVTAVATELANQLTELGHDIDGLQELRAAPAADANGNGNGNGNDNGRSPAGSDPGPLAVDTLEEIRDGQLRLANEQARYQIAFRQDLAQLAALLRRPAG